MNKPLVTGLVAASMLAAAVAPAAADGWRHRHYRGWGPPPRAYYAPPPPRAYYVPPPRYYYYAPPPVVYAPPPPPAYYYAPPSISLGFNIPLR